MKKRKILLAVLVVVLNLFVIGCNGKGASTNTVETSVLKKVIDSGKLRVAILPDNPGWSTLGTDNKYKGVDADIAQLLGEALGVEVVFENTDGAGRISMIQSGKADIVIACLTATNERAKQVAFSNPYAASGILGLCRADNVMNSWNELKDKKIAVPRGSTNDVFASEVYPNANIVRFDAIADGFTALTTGKVDVLLEEDTTVNDLMSKNPNLKIMPVEQQRSAYICMAVKQGDQIWLEYVNNFIRNALYSDKINEIYKTHFNKNMPKLVNY